MYEPLLKVSQQGGYYHVFNRGNHKQDIFLEEPDYLGYLERIRKYKESSKISILCYCLMPNHLHLLIRQDSDVPLYKFIHSVHTSYSMYFNRKYKKVGHLFQGRFRQKTVDKDEYLMQVSSYIHLNPIINGLVKELETYQWSSYPDYIGLRQGTLCDKEMVLAGASPEKYKKFTEQDVKEKLLLKDVIFEVVP